MAMIFGVSARMDIVEGCVRRIYPRVDPSHVRMEEAIQIQRLEKEVANALVQLASLAHSARSVSVTVKVSHA
jgi:hypothetical protein